MIRTRLFPLVSLALVVGWVTGMSLAMAQTKTKADGELNAQTFVKKAASAGKFEVQSSQLALKKDLDESATKRFAQKMVTDHTKANEQLKSLAEKKDIDVPEQLLPEHQAMLKQLQGLDGEEFTRQYHSIQMQAHEEAIDLFSQASDALEDKDLQSFAQSTLPTIKEHYQDLKAHDHKR
jgi:putative membrane protein